MRRMKDENYAGNNTLRNADPLFVFNVCESTRPPSKRVPVAESEHPMLSIVMRGPIQWQHPWYCTPAEHNLYL